MSGAPEPGQPTSLDRVAEELRGALAGLTAAQRIKAAREMAERLRVVLAALERGELDATPTEVARLEGAAVALSMLSGR